VASVVTAPALDRQLTAVSSSPVRQPPETPAASAGAILPPVKLTFYVDQDIDRYLEDVRIQGLTQQPRVDVSRSAVVRLALRRLREKMTPEHVKALLAGQPTDPTKTGRGRAVGCSGEDLTSFNYLGDV